MGNIVASEALRLRSAGPNKPPIVQCYIASQAASVAHAYDAINPAYVLLEPLLRTPEVYAAYPRFTNTTQPYFMGMKNSVNKDADSGKAKIINFHNQLDFALNSSFAWPANQALKPDKGWYCLFPPTSTTHIYWDHTNQLWGTPNQIFLNGQEKYQDDTYNIFAHIAQAESSSLGSAEVPGHHIQGEVGGAVDLHSAPFNYGNNDYEHSAEFRSINMSRRTYWSQVLASFSLTNNPTTP